MAGMQYQKKGEELQQFLRVTQNNLRPSRIGSRIYEF